jgi:hypothetical protein
MTSLPLPTDLVKVEQHTVRQTRAGTIERTIVLSVEEDFGSRTLYGVVFEQKRLKTKVNSASDVYILSRIPADFGVGVHVEKAGSTSDGEQYDVNISDALGHQCSCPAGAYYRGECRHMQMAKAAIQLGLL